MRETYPTDAIVLGRRPLGEASALVTLLAKEVGLVRARAQSVRRPGAKLASSLATLCESRVTLVAGKEGWRVSGAVLRENWFHALSNSARVRASRVAALVLRLVAGEIVDPELYDAYAGYLAALKTEPEELHEALECLAVLRMLAALGLDAGSLPGTLEHPYGREALEEVSEKRTAFVVRANRGIAASGL